MKWTCLAILIFPFYVAACGLSPGASVTLENLSQQPIQEVKVIYTGGVKIIDTLPAAAKEKIKIHPSGESTLRIEFQDSSGASHVQDMNVYFEPGYNEKYNVTIEEGLRLVLSDK